MTRLLGEIFPGSPLRSFQDVRDFSNQTLNPLVGAAFNRESQRKRLRVSFGQLSTVGDQRFVVVSDRRGSIAWSQLKGQAAEHLRDALLELTRFLGKGLVLVPHGELHLADALRRAENLVEHAFTIKTSERSLLTGRQGRVVWFTGLSGSGKSTLANAVSVELTSQGIPHSVLDGDSLRLGLNRDLGFSESDRIENVRRTAEVATLMAESGLVVLVCLVSPYRIDRAKAREIVGSGRFVEVFLDTPLEVCEARDPKGLYAKAHNGLIANFTGVSAPYEAPQDPELVVGHTLGLEVAADSVLDFAVQLGD